VRRDQITLPYQLDSGQMPGKTLARHPTLNELKILFRWHATCFEQILTKVSTSHQLENLELCWFTGKQCDALLQILKGNHYLKCLKVHCGSVALANCLSQCVMNGNLKELILEADGISCPLKHISKRLQHCFPSLTELNLSDYCPDEKDIC